MKRLALALMLPAIVAGFFVPASAQELVCVSRESGWQEAATRAGQGVTSDGALIVLRVRADGLWMIAITPPRHPDLECPLLWGDGWRAEKDIKNERP